MFHSQTSNTTTDSHEFFIGQGYIGGGSKLFQNSGIKSDHKGRMHNSPFKDSNHFSKLEFGYNPSKISILSKNASKGFTSMVDNRHQVIKLKKVKRGPNHLRLKYNGTPELPNPRHLLENNKYVNYF